MNYEILMGNKEALQGNKICRGIFIQVQGLDITEDFLPLTLGSTDVILGIQWISSTRWMHVNWETLIVKFVVNGVVKVLRGDPNLSKSELSLKTLQKTISRQPPILLELH